MSLRCVVLFATDVIYFNFDNRINHRGSNARACLLMRTLFLKRKFLGFNMKKRLPRNDCGETASDVGWMKTRARREASSLIFWFLHRVEFSIFSIFSLFDALRKIKRTRHRFSSQCRKLGRTKVKHLKSHFYQTSNFPSTYFMWKLNSRPVTMIEWKENFCFLKKWKQFKFLQLWLSIKLRHSRIWNLFSFDFYWNFNSSFYHSSISLKYVIVILNIIDFKFNIAVQSILDSYEK